MVGIGVLAFFLIAVNFIAWVIFLKKFKKLFSTDDIIRESREEMRRMIEDMNRVTSRDIDLIESNLKKLKAAAADADRHITVAKNELDKQVKLNHYQSALAKQENVNGSSLYSSAPSYTAAPSQTYTQKAAGSYDRLSDGLSSTQAYTITSQGKKLLDGEQGDLFSQNEQVTYIKSPSGTTFTVENDGTSVASIPKFGPNITFTDDPVKPKKTINQQIRELSDKGYPVELIAKELNMTTTEVQFSLDMGF